MRSHPSVQVFVSIAVLSLVAASGSGVVTAATGVAEEQTEAHASLALPKAAWPDWAVTPAKAKLVILAQHDAAAADVAFGIADIRIDLPVAEAAARYANVLRNGGWIVETARLDGPAGDAEARALHQCLVEGRRDTRLLRLSLDRDQPRASGSLLWARNLSGNAIGATPGSC